MTKSLIVSFVLKLGKTNLSDYTNSSWTFKWKQSKDSKDSKILVKVLKNNKIKAEKHFLKYP